MTATERLRQLIEVRRVVYHWGKPHKITPRFVAAKLGDGQRFVRIIPLNTRPNYYVIRVDSGWLGSGGPNDPMRDHLREIYDAIEDEHGRRHDEDMGDDYNDRAKWPAIDLTYGASWGEYDMPEKRAHKVRG